MTMENILLYIKKQFSKNNLFYTITFLLCLIVIILNRVFIGFSNILWIADIGTICGVLNVVNTAKHNIWGLIFNFISSGFIVVTSIIQHLWLTAIITLFISMPSLFIGIINWHKNQKNNREDNNLKTLNKKSLWIITGSLIALNILFTIILYFLKGNLFYLDSIVSSCCLIGIILSSKMYIEQFYFFIIGNFAGVVMYLILLTQNANNLPYVFLFLVDFVVVIVGLINWKKLKKLQNAQNSDEKS